MRGNSFNDNNIITKLDFNFAVNKFLGEDFSNLPESYSNIFVLSV